MTRQVSIALALLAANLTAQQPKGSLGIAAARGGGVVIVCRHGITGSGDENEMTLRYDDPSSQRRLSLRGERQVEAIGKAFRALEIPVAEIIASPMQRTHRTGELAFGAQRVRTDSAWH